MWVAAHIGTVNWLFAEAQERPQEWLLIILACLVLLWFSRHRLLIWWRGAITWPRGLV